MKHALLVTALLLPLLGCQDQGPVGPPYLVKDIIPGQAGSRPDAGVDVNGTLFFVADDGVHGRELWRSDGTAAGTVLVKDIHPQVAPPPNCRICPPPPGPTSLTAVGSRLFFIAEDGQHGAEPWISDGSEAGTVMVEDVPARRRQPVRCVQRRRRLGGFR